MFKLKFCLPLRNVYELEGDPEKLKKNFYWEEANFREKKNDLLEKEVEKIKKVFYEKGFEEGKKEGENSVLTLSQVFKQAIKALEMEKQSFLKKSEVQLVKIALAIARKIIRKEVSVDPGIVKGIAREALQKVLGSHSEKIVLRVNPRDWEIVKRINEEFLLPDSYGESEIKIEKDSDIEPGGCIVETENQLVNASIEHQLEQIGKALTGEEK